MCSRNSSHFTETNALLPFTRVTIRHSITEFNPDHSLNSILILSSHVRLGLTFSLFTSNFTLQFWHVCYILHARYYAVAIWYSLIWHGDTLHLVASFTSSPNTVLSNTLRMRENKEFTMAVAWFIFYLLFKNAASPEDVMQYQWWSKSVQQTSRGPWCLSKGVHGIFFIR